MLPPSPPDLLSPHLAVGLHCKVFEAWPDLVWHNKRGEWYPRQDPLTAVIQYEDRVHGWFLKWGLELKAKHDAGFVVLMVVIGYLEGNQQFREGVTTTEYSSTAFVARALRRMLPSLGEAEAKKFYRLVRCGLFHDGMTKSGVGIENRAEHPLQIEAGEKFVVSPNKLLDLVVADFDAYLVDLRSPGHPSLTAFMARWNAAWK